METVVSCLLFHLLTRVPQALLKSQAPPAKEPCLPPLLKGRADLAPMSEVLSPLTTTRCHYGALSCLGPNHSSHSAGSSFAHFWQGLQGPWEVGHGWTSELNPSLFTHTHTAYHGLFWPASKIDHMVCQNQSFHLFDKKPYCMAGTIGGDLSVIKTKILAQLKTLRRPSPTCSPQGSPTKTSPSLQTSFAEGWWDTVIHVGFFPMHHQGACQMGGWILLNYTCVHACTNMHTQYPFSIVK